MLIAQFTYFAPSNALASLLTCVGGEKPFSPLTQFGNEVISYTPTSPYIPGRVRAANGRMRHSKVRITGPVIHHNFVISAKKKKQTGYMQM